MAEATTSGICTVVNKYKEPYDVYIGRGSVWGNPFPITPEQSRNQVIEKYKKYFDDQRKAGVFTNDMLLELKGQRLGCFCKPQACHGDIIKKAVNNLK